MSASVILCVVCLCVCMRGCVCDFDRACVCYDCVYLSGFEKEGGGHIPSLSLSLALP